MTLAVGEDAHFHVSTRPAARYRIEIFRLGLYQGLGGRRFACLPSCRTDEQGKAQPLPQAPSSDRALPVRANWPVTDLIQVQPRWLSGYYEARFVLTSGQGVGQGSETYFVVRAPPRRHSQMLVQVPANTWQAYNDWGGRSLYAGPTGAGFRVSFDRPYAPNKQSPLAWEIQLVRYLERSGYDVSYQTDLDTDRDPHSLLQHRVVITAGHDEYWTKGIRDAFEQARDHGVNLAFMGANVGFWQMRYEDAGRTIVEYRNAQLDPEPNAALKTIMFRRLQPPRPECQLRAVNWWGGVGASHDYAPVASALADAWFRNTGFTAASTLRGLVGYEWDAIDPSCSVPTQRVLFHWTGTTANADADAVRYIAPSGAIVFSTGSLQFSWGLDAFGNRGQVPADARLQQFMRNALRDLVRRHSGRPAKFGRA